MDSIPHGVQLPLFAFDKRCSVCGALKALDDFHRNRHNKDGHSSACKDCACARAQAWLRENKDRASQRARAYRQAHAVELAVKKRAYHGEHRAEHRAYCAARYQVKREEAREQSRAYDLANRAAILSRVREQQAHYRALPRERTEHGEKMCGACQTMKPLSDFHRNRSTKDGHLSCCKVCFLAARALEYQRNRERYREERRAWREAHPEHVKRWYRQRRLRHPEAHRLAKMRRRAREAMLEGTATAADLRLIYQCQRGRCVYCLVPLTDRYHVDHMIAVSVPGCTNWPFNLALACATCNQAKQARSAGEYLALLLRRDNRELLKESKG